MKELQTDILTKWDIIELKLRVISILHSLQFDDVYDSSHCIKDLNELLIYLDEIERDYENILSHYQNSYDQCKQIASLGS